MKAFIATLILASSFSAFAQQIITAEKKSDGADICFYKQIQLKGYSYANLIGRCAWDPAMNGMELSLVAVPEDPNQEAHTLSLDNIRDVKLVQNKSLQLQATVIQDDMDADGNIKQKTKVIYVRAVDAEKGLFSVKN
jgi:hypothetical protein